MKTEFAVGVLSSIVATILFVGFSAARRRPGWSVRTLRRQVRLGRQVDEAGLLYFFPSRSAYQRYRNTPTQISYFQLANKRIEVVAHSFGYGQRAQGIASDLPGMLEGNPSLRIVFAILDPRSSYVGSLARYLGALAEPGEQETGRVRDSANAAEERLRFDITETLLAFHAARESMAESLRVRFTIKVYDTLPTASVIMLDRGEPGGRAQVDVKLFGGPYHKSMSFEVGNGSELYKAVSNAWGTLLNSAEVFDPTKHVNTLVRNSDDLPIEPDRSRNKPPRSPGKD